MRSAVKKTGTKKLLFVTFFAIILLLVVHRHELWRDELQAWSIAINSRNLTNLYQNLKYEGNAGLWHFLLYMTNKVYPSFTALKLINAVITIAICAVFTFLMPIKWWKKILFVFGYFVFYEYGVIARNYALGILLFFLAIWIHIKYKDFILTKAILLVLAALTGPYTAIMAFGIVFTDLYLLSKDFIKKRSFLDFQTRLKLAGIIIVLLGIIFSFILSIPPEDGSYQLYRNYKDIKLFKQTLSKITTAFIPIPKNEFHFWNTNIIENLNITSLLAIVILVMVIIALRKSLQALIFYLVSTGLFLTFSYIKFSGTVRHLGHLYIIFWGAVILAGQTKDKKSRFNTFFILTVLLIQIYACFIAVSKDWKYSFYSAGDISRYILQHNMQDWYLIGDDDIHSIAVANILNKRIYFPKARRGGYFIKWDKDRDMVLRGVEITIPVAIEKYYDHKKETLMILDYQIKVDEYPVEYLASFDPGIAENNPLYLYRLDLSRINLEENL